MRVIHCAETIKGGIATYLNELLPRQLISLGADNITLLIPSDQIEHISPNLRQIIVTFTPKKHRIISTLYLWKEVNKLLIRNREPTILHAHSTFAGVAARLSIATWQKTRHIIYCPHGWSWDRKVSTTVALAYKLSERLLSITCSKIICISDHEYQSALKNKLPHRKLVAISNGLTISGPLHPAPLNDIWPGSLKKILFVGRLDRQKGYDTFIESLNLLDEPVSARIVGSGVLDSPKDIFLPDNCTLCGWLPQSKLREMYNLADVLVIPSRWEGFGLVALEGMNAKLPIIASSVGGLKEIVVDGVTGYLTQPDSPESIAAALRKINPTTKRTLGEAGFNRLQQYFSFDITHQKILDIYDDLHSQPAPN